MGPRGYLHSVPVPSFNIRKPPKGVPWRAVHICFSHSQFFHGPVPRAQRSLLRRHSVRLRRSRSDTNKHKFAGHQVASVYSVRFSQSVSQLFHGPAPRSPLHRLSIRLRRSRSDTSTEYSLPGATQLSQVCASSGNPDRIFLGYSCSALSRERTHRIGQEILVIQRSFIVAWHLAAPPHEDAPLSGYRHARYRMPGRVSSPPRQRMRCRKGKGVYYLTLPYPHEDTHRLYMYIARI